VVNQTSSTFAAPLAWAREHWQTDVIAGAYVGFHHSF
jgi:hypothetical protein